MVIAPSLAGGQDPFNLASGEYVARELYLRAGDRVDLRFSANGRVGLYILDSENFALFKQGKTFRYETGTPVPTSFFARTFIAPHEALWTVVLYNAEKQAAYGAWRAAI